MPPTTEKIKLIEAALSLGFSLSEAVQKALGGSLSDFAERHGARQTEVSMCLLGYHQRVYPEIRDALCTELEIKREELDRLIDDERQRRAA